MKNENRLIRVGKAVHDMCNACSMAAPGIECKPKHCTLVDALRNIPAVDAVSVALIKEFKQKILETLDNLIAIDEPLANYTPQNSYYRGKVDAFEISRRLVNAALTDLCDHCGAKMDGGNEDEQRKA